MHRYLSIALSIIAALILAAILFAVFVVGPRDLWKIVTGAPATTAPVVTQTTEPVTITGKEVLDGIAALLMKSLNEDGTFTQYYQCIKGVGCEPMVERPINTPHATAFLLRYSEEIGSADMRAAADRSMVPVLAACEKDAQECEDYFVAFAAYYKVTKDEKYLTAMKKAAPLILKRASHKETYGFVPQIVGWDIGNKLATLYTVTSEKKYSTALIRLADMVAAQNLSVFGGALLYSHNGVEMYDFAPTLGARVILPAYQISQDQRYLDLLKSIYLDGAVGTNAAILSEKSRSPLVTVEYSIAALTELSELLGSSKDKQQSVEQANLLTQLFVRNRIDAEQRSIFDSSNNFVTGSTGYIRRPQGVDYATFSYKGVNENGYAGLVLLDAPHETLRVSLPQSYVIN